MSHTFSRRQLLASGAAALTVSSLPWWATSHAQAIDNANRKNLILFYANGGWDATCCLDPKQGVASIDSAPGDVKLYGSMPILIGDERPAVETFFDAYGEICATVHGIEVRSIAHEECTKRLFTGTNQSSNPDIGSILGHEEADKYPVPYMVLGNTSFSGRFMGTSGKAGSTMQLSTLLDDDRFYAFDPKTPYNPKRAERSAISSYLTDKHVADVSRRQSPENVRKLDALASANERGEVLRPLAGAFGEQQFGLELDSQIDLAIRVLREKVSRAVTIQDPGDWDTHDNNDARQFGALQAMYTGLNELVRRLEEEGLLQDTVIVVMSEMSRTPKKNEGNGKDHWPVTSALVLGAGVAGGRAYGATSDTYESVAINHATGEPDENGTRPNAASFAAGLLEHVGVSSEPYFPDATPLSALSEDTK